MKAAGAAVTGVTIPDNEQPAITYPIAVVKSGKSTAAAEAFIQSARTGAVHQALLSQGFLAP